VTLFTGASSDGRSRTITFNLTDGIVAVARKSCPRARPLRTARVGSNVQLTVESFMTVFGVLTIYQLST
jgi:hypothetical protein